MFIEFTVYPPRAGLEPQVGYNAWTQEAQPRYQVGGSPSVPISEFVGIVQGTSQHGNFLHECSRLGIDLKLWHEL